jgi:hypothetical protein
MTTQGRILKSAGLFLITFLGIWMLGTLFFGFWLILFCLFLDSRFSKAFPFFRDWTWVQFMATLLISLAIPIFLLAFGPRH